MRQPDARVINWVVAAAVMLSFVSGALHLWLAPEHFEEWWGYGVFFVVAGIGQLLFAAALVVWPRSFHPFPRRWIMAVGILANVALVAFYLFTRTVGVPLGPEAGEVEPVRLIDIITKLAEVFLVGALAILVICRRAAGPAERPRGQFPSASQPH